MTNSRDASLIRKVSSSKTCPRTARPHLRLLGPALVEQHLQVQGLNGGAEAGRYHQHEVSLSLFQGREGRLPVGQVGDVQGLDALQGLQHALGGRTVG